MQRKKVFMWGASGQARVLQPIITDLGLEIAAIFDKDLNIEPPNFGNEFFNNQDELYKWLNKSNLQQLYFVLAIGSNCLVRLELTNKLTTLGMQPLTLVHQTAFVARSATLAPGCQILAMASICELASIGAQTIINTQASVDHETIIGDCCHIMPGATIAGAVNIGRLTAIGSNATILPRISIGHSVIVGAGAVVTKDVSPFTTVVGNPAKPIKKTKEQEK